MNICTWNSQGNPYTTQKKIEILNQFMNMGKKQQHALNKV